MIARAPRAPRDLDERRDILSLLLQARDRGRRGADRPRAARRAADARARRPRDDRQLARLDLGAAASARPTPTTACATPVRSRRATPTSTIEATIIEGMRSRPGDPDHRPPRDGAVAARRLRGAGRHAGRDEHPARSTTARTSTPSRSRSGPSAGSAASPGTYEWIPFGGGIRRCLGAALAMAEQRVVLRGDGPPPRPRGRRPRARARRAPQRDDDPGARRARGRAVEGGVSVP